MLLGSLFGVIGCCAVGAALWMLTQDMKLTLTTSCLFFSVVELSLIIKLFDPAQDKRDEILE